jgi:uncharacterized protein
MANRPEIVKMLLAAGADVEIRTHFDSVPLHHAAEHGHLEIVKMLLEAGAHVNAQDLRLSGCTPLHRAIDSGHQEVVETLLAAGADPNLRGLARGPLQGPGVGMNSFESAIAKVHPKIVQTLLKAGADVNEKGYLARRPLQTAILAAVQGETPDPSEHFGSTKITRKTKQIRRQQVVEVVRILVEAGAAVSGEKAEWRSKDIPEADGQLPLQHAISIGNDHAGAEVVEMHAEIVRILLAAKADPNEPGAGWCALHGAAQEGHVKIAKLLLDAGAEVDVREAKKPGSKPGKWKEQRTPLLGAVREGHEDMVKLLLEAGAAVP